MTAAERTLLLALFRWARSEGCLDRKALWVWARRSGEAGNQWGIDFDPDAFDPGEPVSLEIWRGRTTAKSYWVASVAEAVDVLVALGIAPARFSTAYRAGWDIGREDDEHPQVGAEFRAIVPAVPA